METIHEARRSPAAAPVAGFVASGALLAAGTAAVLWTRLPYERFGRFTAPERFLLWEGLVWLIALVAGGLGLAAILQVVGLNLRAGLAELARRLSRRGPEHALVSTAAVLAWWMVAYSLCLIAIAAAARAYLPG